MASSSPPALPDLGWMTLLSPAARHRGQSGVVSNMLSKSARVRPDGPFSFSLTDGFSWAAGSPVEGSFSLVGAKSASARRAACSGVGSASST